jgi:Flp pilus assembly protein TadG
MLKRYLYGTGGNVAMMFSGTILVVLMGIGAAIDFNGMSSQRVKYQALADMAVLAAAASGEDNPAELKKIAKAAVDGNNFTGDDLTTNLSIPNGNTLRVEVSSNYKTSIMGLFGMDTIAVKAGAEAPPKGQGKINLALVLDVTGSMSGSKIATLRTAATDLVDSLSDTDGDGIGDDGGNSMFAVVPFARYVQIPMSYSTAPWLDIVLEEDCDINVDWDNSTGCTDITVTDDDDGIIETYTTTTCTNYAYLPEVCETEPWDGCVGSRTYPWNTRDYYGGMRIPGREEGLWCDDELVPLTNQVSVIKDKIDDIDTDAETYIPSGLVWGWRALSPDAPLVQADTADRTERKSAMLLMTDGANTRSVDSSEPEFHWGNDVDAANTITSELCEGAKASGIIIYTVAFDVTDVDTIAMLRNCATDPTKFFDAGDGTALELAFEDVGKDLARVILSK